MIKKMSMKEAEKRAAEKGFKPAPADHPIYSEGATIMFVDDYSGFNIDVVTQKSTKNKSKVEKIKGVTIDLGPVDIDLRPGLSFSSNIWIRFLKDDKYEISMLAENEEETDEYDDEGEPIDNDIDEAGADPVIEIVGEFTEEEAIEYLDNLGLEFPFK